MEKWERRDKKIASRRKMKVDGRGMKTDYPNAIRKHAREVRREFMGE